MSSGTQIFASVGTTQEAEENGQSKSTNVDRRIGAALKSLDIQGFRSFGGLAADVGHIDWLSPVTLILGPNGTGKTTIIECLKFATTGEFPPNSNRGSAFVHDPKLSASREVRAQVSLKFFGADSRDYVLTRTAEAKAVKNSRGVLDVKFRTLETTLHCYENGRKLSTPLTVDQAGQTMQTILGVSKPIINSVIFCHQEDADWPLDQAAKLKEKFDEIFSATKYTKALDEFRELKKKDKGELDLAKERRDQKMIFRDEAQKKEEDLSEIKRNRDSIVTALEELQKNLTDGQTKQDSLQASSDAIAVLEKELESLSSKISSLTKSIVDLESRLGEEFAGTTEELEREMRDSKNIDLDKRAKLAEATKRGKEMDAKLTELRKSLAKMSQTLGTLKAETEQNRKVVAERDAKIKDLATVYEMKVYFETTEFLSAEIEAFDTDFSKRLTDEENKLEEHAKNSTAEVDDLTRRIAEKKLEQEALAKNITKLKKEIRDKGLREETIADELADMQAQSETLESLESKITAETELLTAAENEVNLEEMRLKVAEDSQRKKDLTAKLKPLKTTLQQKEKQQSLFTQIDLLTSQQNEKKDAVEKQRNKLLGFLDKIGSELKNEEIKSTLDSKLKETNQLIEDAKRFCSQTETTIAVKEKERSHVRIELDSLQTKIKEFDNELEEVASAGHGNIDASLRQIEDDIKKWQSELAELEGKSHVFKGFRELLSRSDGKPCCPTCHRGFSDESEATELIEELETSVRDIPERVVAQNSRIAEGGKKRDRIVAFMPEVKKNEQLRKKIEELEAKQKKLAQEISELNTEKSAKDASVEEVTAFRQICLTAQPDVLKLESLLSDLKKNEKDHKTASSKVQASSDTRSLDEIKTEKDEIEAEIEKLGKSVDELRDMLSGHETKINKLKENVNKLRDQKLRITEKVQERLKLEHQLNELKNDIAKAKTELEELAQKDSPLKQVLEAIIVQKTHVHKNWSEIICTQDDLVDNMKEGQKDLAKLAKKIKDFEKKGTADRLQTVQGDVESLTDEIKRKETERAEFSDDIRRMEKDVDNVANRTQILKDNKALRDNREELKVTQRSLEELKDKLTKENTTAIRDELKVVIQDNKDVTKKLHTQQGRKAELDKTIRAKEKELDAAHYKNAKKEFSQAAIKCQVLDMAMKDVEKFYKALDFAVMKFHSTKMEEINKIIRDLWQSTYQGNDIDYIEIRSDAENNSIEGDKSRRNYNYRVVMVSGDTALDMRGRCSAGQRVLACLIIRLALAEAFAMNCGILALDEPTTNLDRDNIEHLAKSLSNLIRSRCTDFLNIHRFQLIIITHDSEFLNMLNTASTGPLVDSYYKIWKESGGKSRLKKINYTGHF